MLVLSTKVNKEERVSEPIMITTKSGEVIEVYLLKVKGNQARIGFRCDKDNVQVDSYKNHLRRKSGH
jgi:sRNA-binding carbon storage regulator CsrA